MTEQELDEMASELLAQSLAMNACRNDGRRYCCEYHQGFEDGMDALMTVMANHD